MPAAPQVARVPLHRIEQAVRSIAPRDAPVEIYALPGGLVRVAVGPGCFRAGWIGEGRLGDVWAALADPVGRPEVLVGRRMSRAAREAAAEAGAGWIDESGAAEISVPGLLISRTGRADRKPDRPPRWTGSVIGTAEALLIGIRPTVDMIAEHTGMSTGSAVNALATLTELGLLRARVPRGPASAREIVDQGQLLDAYAEAAASTTPRLSLRVGTSARDLIDELARLGMDWDRSGVAWAATGAAGASRLGPYFSEVSGLDVFIDLPSLAALDSFAERSGLRPIEGGRILLRPFPTRATALLSSLEDGLRIAPWPRIYADLRTQGVRGEEASEHLREQMDRG